VPHCYFVVAVAEELGLSFSRRGLTDRSVTDNAFDEIISLEPMSLELSRELLTRRVPGFTEPFVQLSFVLSGGLPRDLIRVARRLAELTIESDYELRLAESAERLIHEEIHEAAIGTRSQIARLSLGQEWNPVLDRLRLRAKDLQPEVKSVDLIAILRDLAELPRLLPISDPPDMPSPREAVIKLAAFALLDLTTCDLFKEDRFDLTRPRNPTDESSGPFEELATARRELSISAESCRASVEAVRLSLNVDQSAIP